LKVYNRDSQKQRKYETNIFEWGEEGEASTIALKPFWKFLQLSPLTAFYPLSTIVASKFVLEEVKNLGTEETFTVC
jgi:hypothetical protein